MAKSVEERAGGTGGNTTGSRDLKASLCVLALIAAFVLSGLAWDENWRKLLRVLIGFIAYVTVLLSALGLYSLRRKRRASFPFWAFALSGAMAEAGSGWLRPTATTKLDILTVLLASILIGGVHWLALRYWRPLRERIMRVERKMKSNA